MSLKKKFLHYMLPSVVAMWVFSIYTMVDGIFVAKGVGEIALAAVNIAMPFINFVFALSLWFAVGTSTLIAIAMGKGKQDEANQIFSLNTTILVILSVVITALALFNLDRLALFLGATENTLGYVKDYLGIIIVFSVFFIISYSLEVLVKTDGFPILATVGVCISALTNVILDYIFVLELGWGIKGAAWATGISQLLLLVVFMIHFLGKRSKLQFVPFKWDLKIYGRILPIGFADCITEFSTGMVIFMFNRTILAVIGESAIVSYTIISYLNTLILMTMIGISQGMQPLVSFYHGQRKPEISHKLLGYALFCVVLCSMLAFGLSQWLAEPLVGVFIQAEHESLFSYSVIALKLFSFSFLLLGFNVVISGFFAAIERSQFALIISLARGFVLIALSLGIMVTLVGSQGIWLATALSEALCLMISAILMVLYYRRHKRIQSAKTGKKLP